VKSTSHSEPIGDGRPALYWTPAEFAEVVALSAKSVYRLVKDDATFPTVKILGSSASRKTAR
jgi:predicted DNA-binding transcriptional regulator AlpA